MNTLRFHAELVLGKVILSIAIILISLNIESKAATLNVQDFGVVGDGVNDDSSAIQSAFNAAAFQNATLQIPANFVIRTTKNLFIFGQCNIQGAGDSSVILCDADLSSHLGRLYWISIGITNHKNNGGTQRAFVGSISNLCIKASSSAKFNRALFTFNTTSMVVSNVLFDFMDGTSLAGEILFGATASGFNNNWAPTGTQQLQNITISNNRILANHGPTDSEGFGVSLASKVLIANNYIFGVGDDPIGCHTVTDLEVRDNECYSLDGRILATNCTKANIHDNYCERIAGPNSTWYGGGAMIMASLEGNNSAPAPNDLQIRNNVISIPAAIPSYTYGIRVRGAMNAEIISNVLIMDSSAGGGGIRIEADTSYPGWVDPTGTDMDGIARPRNITVANNSSEGLFPGFVEQTGPVGTLPGPFSIHSNMAAGYLWYTPGLQVANSNLVLSGRYSNFNVPLSSLSDARTIFSSSLMGVVSNVITGGSGGFLATVAGRISGFNAQAIPLITSGWINIKLLKNGMEIGNSTVSANGTVTLDRTNPSFAFYPGDRFEVKASGAPGLLPSGGVGLQLSFMGVTTDLSAFYDFDGTELGADLSGNGNSGVATNCVVGDGITGHGVSLSGAGEIVAVDKACLDIADNLSICFWLNGSDLPAGYAGHIVKKSTDTTDANFDCYYFGTTGGIHQGKIAFYANAGGVWRTISPFYVLPQHQWVHIALVYTASTGGQLYINGTASGTKVGSGALALNDSPLKIGTGIKGNIDQLRIYNRALSTSEIASLYALGK